MSQLRPQTPYTHAPWGCSEAHKVTQSGIICQKHSLWQNQNTVPCALLTLSNRLRAADCKCVHWKSQWIHGNLTLKYNEGFSSAFRQTTLKSVFKLQEVVSKPAILEAVLPSSPILKHSYLIYRSMMAWPLNIWIPSLMTATSANSVWKGLLPIIEVSGKSKAYFSRSQEMP